MLYAVGVLFLAGSAANGWAWWQVRRHRRACRRAVGRCEAARDEAFESVARAAIYATRAVKREGGA